MKNILTFSFSVTAFTLLLATPALSAGLYKCVGEHGAPLYQNEPCAPGKELRNMTHDNSLSVVPLTVPEPLPAEDGKAAAPAAKAPAKASQPQVRVVPKTDNTLGNTARARMAIQPGMTRQEVLDRLGAPPMTAGENEGSSGTVRWYYMPTNGDPNMTTVVMQRGAVVSVEREPKK
jgi:hypothetical protein